MISGANLRRPGARSLAATLAVSILGLAVVAAVCSFVYGHYGSLDDDAFVYLRYARNVRDGCGLRWVCQDTPVEGFTSPGWLALLLLTALFIPTYVNAVEALAGVTLAVALTAAVLLSWRLTSGKERPLFQRLAAPFAVALALGSDHAVLVNGVLGVESPLVALVVLALAAAVLAGRPWLAIAAALLAGLVTGPSLALALAASVPLAFARRTPRVANDRLLWFALIGGLVLEVGARFAIFGDFVPNGFWTTAGGGLRHFVLGGTYLLKAMITFPALALAPCVLVDRQWRDRARPLLASFTLWLLTFLWTGGDAASLARAAFPLVPAATVLAVEGIFALSERAVSPGWSPLVTAGAGVLLAARAELHRAPVAHEIEEVAAWARIGSVIHRHAPTARVAAVSTGALGYFSRSDVLDLGGRTRRDIARGTEAMPPEALTSRAVGHERFNLPVIARERPDVIMTTVSADHAFTSLDGVQATNYVEGRILGEVRRGRLRYIPLDMEVTPGKHWLLLRLWTPGMMDP